jgi:hypothetical protein
MAVAVGLLHLLPVLYRYTRRNLFSGIVPKQKGVLNFLRIRQAHSGKHQQRTNGCFQDKSFGVLHMLPLDG